MIIKKSFSESIRAVHEWIDVKFCHRPPFGKLRINSSGDPSQIKLWIPVFTGMTETVYSIVNCFKLLLVTMVISLFSLSLTGCLYFRSHPAGIQPIAKETDYYNYEILGDAEGSSSRFALLWFIPVTPPVTYDEAVTEAIRSKGGDNLIEVTSWSETKTYIVGTVYVLYVKGKVIRYISNTQERLYH